MALFPSPEKLAGASVRFPWLVVAAWAVLLAAGLFLGAGIGSVLSTDQEIYEEIEALKAERLIEDHVSGAEPPKEYVLVHSATATVDDPAFRDLAYRLANDMLALEGRVAVVFNYYDNRDTTLVSESRHTLLMPVVLEGSADDAEENATPLMDLLRTYDGRDGFEVVTGGEGSIGHTFMETSERDLQKAEIIGLPVALVVLVVVFGALVAAGVPILLGLLSIAIAIGITALVGRAFELSTFVINMISMIGLAVGIDYSLLIIQRFREERRKGASVESAIAITGRTASRAVLFSGLSVIVALGGLLIFPDNIFRSLAAGAIIVVVVTIAAALTLLPAVLRILGDRVDRVRIRIPGHRSQGEEGGFWTVVTGAVIRHPVVSVVATVALLVAATLPYFTIKLGQAGASSLPEQSEAYRAFALLESEFNAGLLTPTDIVIEASDVTAPQVVAAVDRLRTSLRNDEAFGLPETRVSGDRELVVLSLAIRGDSQGQVAIDALDRLRNSYIPAAFDGTGAKAFVAGDTAWVRDYGDLVDKYTPIVFAFVLGLSFIILLVVFRSIVVPLKAIVMNLLSVGAAYGLIVLIFQQGIGADLFGFRQVERIESWVPLFMFAVLFGLSMDYHVFLLTRIRERFDETRDNAGSVAFGVRTTAGMITGAALIMVAVFAGFAMGELVMMQQMGFGLAIAVIIDATIIRSVLVPASMVLLGERNWYLPAWLGWIPRVRVEGAAPVHG